MSDLAGLYNPDRPHRRCTDRCPVPVEVTDDLGWAAHLLDASRADWLRGTIPNAARAAVVIAERAALDAAIAAALAAAPTLDPTKAGCRRQGGQ